MGDVLDFVAETVAGLDISPGERHGEDADEDGDGDVVEEGSAGDGEQLLVLVDVANPENVSIEINDPRICVRV